MSNKEEKIFDILERAYSEVFSKIFGGGWKKGGLKETPRRIARSFVTRHKQEILRDVVLPEVTLFPAEGYDQIIIQGGMNVVSFCEHHDWPFYGEVIIGYFPDKYIWGASKPSRIIDFFAQKFQIQERLVGEIADYLYKVVEPAWVIVYMKCKHTCMTCRGASQANSHLTTIAVRGTVPDSMKQEYYSILQIEAGRK